jgi:hypothetical protein
MITIPLLLALGGEAQAQDTSFFAGTILTDQTVDTLVDYRHTKGTQVTAESIDHFWSKEHSWALGARSPILLDRVQLSTVGELGSDLAWAYTLMGDVRLSDIASLRAGAIQDTEAVGGFVGGELHTDRFSLDADAWVLGRDSAIQGYIGGLPYEKLYLSLGGDYSQKKATLLGSWLGDGEFGVYSQVNADFASDSQSVKFLVADRFTLSRGAMDFKSHIFSGTKMREVTTGGVLDTWAPLDSKMTKRLALRVSGNNSPDNSSAEARAFVSSGDQLVAVGLGPILDASKGLETSAGFEVYAAVPKSPLEVWVDTSYNVNNGSFGPTKLYFGGNGQW